MRATDKKYYWMKLREDFMRSELVDYFMDEQDGAKYLILYQLLCLKTINTGGKFITKIGNIVIPYSMEKIQRDCKWFTIDTIRVALELFKSVGLIYTDEDGILVISDHKNLVGSETTAAARMRESRTNKNNQDSVTLFEHCSNNVTLEIRDKSLDLRVKDSRYQMCKIEDDLGGIKSIIDTWNTLNVFDIATVDVPQPESPRGKALENLLNIASADEIKMAINHIKHSTFLKGGKNDRWKITLDWFLKPANYSKVAQGTYDDYGYTGNEDNDDDEPFGAGEQPTKEVFYLVR